MVVGADYKQLDVVATFSPIYLKKQLKSRPVSDSVLLSLIVTSLRPELCQNKFYCSSWSMGREGEPGMPQSWRSLSG